MSDLFLRQKLRQELLSRQGSVEATRDSISSLLKSSDPSTVSGLQVSLHDLSQRYTAAQASQSEREAELKALLPRLESYERLEADLQAFMQSRLKTLTPVGLPDRSVDDYRQTIEVSRVDERVIGEVNFFKAFTDSRVCFLSQEVKSELEQEASQLKSFCSLGTEISQSKALTNTQNLLDNVNEVSDEFGKLEENVNKRYKSSNDGAFAHFTIRTLGGTARTCFFYSMSSHLLFKFEVFQVYKLGNYK